MIVRELPDGSALCIPQENHADVAAQFAAHWGNERFASLTPYQSTVFATIYHDSGHREMEADLPFDVERGLPYGIGGTPPALRKRDADSNNARWVQTRDPYASLLISMHHAGLKKRRYGTVQRRGNPSRGAADPQQLGMEAAFADLEDWQRESAERLGLSDPTARAAFWHNYCMLQVFDQLSLYVCWDGYQGEQLVDELIASVPVAPGTDDLTDLHLEPVGHRSVRVSPYPFDAAPLSIATLAHQMNPVPDVPEEEARAAFYRARRVPLTWEIARD